MLEPYFVECKADLERLAEEMKAYARREPIDKEIQYSKNEEEATERARNPEMIKHCEEDPNIRVVIFRRLVPVTLGFTLDQHKDPVCWTLSMSIPNPPHADGRPNIGRVADTLANVIASAFFGEGWLEVPPEGAFKTVRQFEKAV